MSRLLHIFEKLALLEISQSADASSLNFQESNRLIRKCYSSQSLDRGNCYLNFDIPIHRCVYLLMYAASHTKMVELCMKNFAEESSKKYFNWLATKSQHQTLKICVLGGGPSVDVCGIMKALKDFLERNEYMTVEVITIDVKEGWKNTSKNVLNEFRKCLKLKVELKQTFMICNLLQPLPSRILKEVAEADIISSVKTISALAWYKRGCRELLETLFRNMKKDAIFVYVDNSGGRCYQVIQSITRQENMKSVCGPVRKTRRVKIIARRKYAQKFKRKYGFPARCSAWASIGVWMKS